MTNAFPGRRRRLRLLLPALGLYAADVALTLCGQSTQYQAGDYGQAVEFNPVAYPLLAAHPLLFVGAAVGWGATIAVIVLRWRHRAAEWLAKGLALAHAFGGSTWLARHGPAGWALAVCYLAAAVWLCRVCWRRAGVNRRWV